jgi:hypothetical protein
MKRILIVSALILCSIVLHAQQTLEDVIYLKSGKVVRGQILEQNSEEVRILLVGKYNFTYQQSEIEKMTKEPTTSNSVAPVSRNYTSGSSKVKEEKPVSPNGYIGIIEAGYGFAEGDFGMDYLKLDIINGYRFNQHFSLGLGVGARAFDEAKLYESGSEIYPEVYDAVFIPVFLSLRINLSKGKVAPYLALNAGKSFDTSMVGLGTMFSPGAGLRFGLGAKSALNLGVSYDSYKLPFYNFNTDAITEEASNAISVNLGISF